MGKIFVLVTLVALSLTATTSAFADTPTALELLTVGEDGFINQAYFLQGDYEHSTGTGIIQPFLHVQQKGVEQGYNTDGSTDQFPESNSPWTKSLLLSAVPVVSKLNEQGVYENYREFLLDINESSGGGDEGFLSLDALQLFVGPVLDPEKSPLYYPDNLGTKIWDMDASTNWTIYLDYSLETGSGSGDMLAYIPSRLFTGGDYVYLYCMFGDQGTDAEGRRWGAWDGFEEWAVKTASPPVPEPGGLLAFATGLISLIGLSTRRFRS